VEGTKMDIMDLIIYEDEKKRKLNNNLLELTLSIPYEEYFLEEEAEEETNIIIIKL
jgi:hypothetical protein